MKIIAQTPAVYSYLHHLLSKAIHSSVTQTVARCTNKAQEPDYVAGLVLDFTPELFSILKSVYIGISFSVSGIFCHQKPLAHIPKQKPDPEIGDILFVLINSDKQGVKKLNSLLFQAKMSSKATFTVNSSDEHQLQLYTQWPDFSYKRAGPLTGTRRCITPKSVSRGAQFMLIDDDPTFSLAGHIGTFPIGCATPNKQVVLNTDLASELIEFIMHRSGRAFGNIDAQHDAWTRMIWDLISITKAKASKRINSGIASFPRTTSMDFDCLYFLTSDPLSGRNRSIFSELDNSIFFEGRKNSLESPSDSGAVSLVLIESFENQDS